jgi:hypothetical protein
MAQAGRGRGRGRTGRGNRRTSMVIDLRDPTAADPVAPAAGPSSTLSDARERPRLATAALDAPNGDANAATRLKEMQMLKAKIAAMEKRKLRRQVFSESVSSFGTTTAMAAMYSMTVTCQSVSICQSVSTEQPSSCDDKS